MSVATIFFMAALFIGFYLFKSVGNTIDTMYKSNQDLDRNQSSTLKVLPVYTVSGATVLQTIYQIQSTGVPVEVQYYDSSTDPPTLKTVDYLADLDIDKTDVSQIDVTKSFTPRYERDSSGAIIQIIYTQEMG
jgi:hypothetical protein